MLIVLRELVPDRARGISSLCGTLDSFTPTDLKQLLISDSHQTSGGSSAALSSTE
jgi:hypothetical protein